MSIRLLPDDVIAKIAAGEVVERPASVVKELIENALDAGATYIRVEIGAGGRALIRVSDDGSGIPADEVLLAVTRHATSKLNNPDDLYAIRTLGFRGEALASVVAVSRASVVTRHREEQVGTQIRIEGGEITQHKPVGAPAGTVITVENLFYNTPARLKFLKSEATERRHITNILTHYAIAYPQVRFVLVQDEREIFQSVGSGQLSDVMVKVFGLDVFRQMMVVEAEQALPGSTELIRVWGYVSDPDLHRRDRTRITTFVNGRFVQDSKLTYAVTQAYHTFLTNGHYPYATIMLNVPPHFVDVNVHPTKSEVRFQDANVVFSAVQRAVRQAIIAARQLPTARPSAISSEMAPTSDSPAWHMPYTQPAQQRDFNWELGRESGTDGVTDVNQAIMTAENADPTAIPEGPGRPEKPRTLPPLRVVGQVGAAYVVAEGPSGMYLVDQFAAHQRVIYDELRELFLSHETMPSFEIEGQTVDLAPRDANALEQRLNDLAILGFTLEPFGSTTFKIRALPTRLAKLAPADCVTALIADLGESENFQEAVLMRIARMAAVKSGHILSLHEMQELVRKLERCKEPRTSPYGQPTLLHMSADHLAREFRRQQAD